MAARRLRTTGGTDFVGARPIAHLHDVLPALEGYRSKVSITDEATVLDEVVRINPDILVHLAAIPNDDEAREHPSRAWCVNVHSTIDIARALASRCSGCLLTPYGLGVIEKRIGAARLQAFAALVVACPSQVTGRHPTIAPVVTAEDPPPARRAANSELEIGRFENIFRYTARPRRHRTEERVAALLGGRASGLEIEPDSEGR